MRDSVESVGDGKGLQRVDASEVHLTPSARYSNKIEMTSAPRRQNTIEVDAILKRVREREKPKNRILSEKPRRVQTITLDDDTEPRVSSGLQPN